jgi:uncharacterized membrane protein
MDDARADVAAWVEAGAVPRSRMREALEAVQAVPSPAAWRAFLERLLLWTGLVALSAALGFFVAANWQALGRFGKLALVEGAIVAALGVVLWRGLDSGWGRAMLLVASLAVGTLLALVGQTYQTGADTWELFAVWAIAIAPWVLAARQPALWVLWVAIVDVAAWLYLSLSLHWINVAFGDKHALWAILAIHVIVLVAWEGAIVRGVRWLDVRWGPRLIAVGAGVAATMLVVDTLLDRGRAVPGTLAYLGLIAALYYAYRIRRVDVFVLAAGVLSLIVVVVATIVRWDVLDGAGGFLLIGLVIVALAALGARWLRTVAREA